MCISFSEQGTNHVDSHTMLEQLSKIVIHLDRLGLNNPSFMRRKSSQTHLCNGKWNFQYVIITSFIP